MIEVSVDLIVNEEFAHLKILYERITAIVIPFPISPTTKKKKIMVADMAIPVSSNGLS